MNELPTQDITVTGLSHSESLAKIAEALALAQGEMSGAKKGSANPFFKSRYADLAAVIGAIREPLSNHGIAHVQSPGNDSEGPFLDTILIHSSGEWLKGRLHMTPVKDDPQGLGSVITYMRRYALQAMSGLEAEDDDGNHASRRDDKSAHRPNPPRGRQAEDEDQRPADDFDRSKLPKTQPLAPGTFEPAKTVSDPIPAIKTPPEVSQTPNQAIPDDKRTGLPIITNWRDIPYTNDKKKTKLLGACGDAFLDSLTDYFSKVNPKTKEHMLVKAALAIRSGEMNRSPLDDLLARAQAEHIPPAILLVVAQKGHNSAATRFEDVEEEILGFMIEDWDKVRDMAKFEMDDLPDK